jgi:hypothetical protein
MTRLAASSCSVFCQSELSAGLVSFRSQTVTGEKHRDRGPLMFAYLGFGHRCCWLSDQGLQMMLRDHRAEKELRGAQQRLGTDLSRPAVSGWARQRSTVSKSTRRALAHDFASAR